MAALGIAAAGAVLGGGAAGFLGGSVLTGIGIGWAAGSFLGGQLFPQEIKTKGPRLNDLRVSVSTYGVKIPQIWSTVREPTNMFWSTGIQEHKKKQTTGGGLLGKGGGGVSQTLVTYSYTLTAAYGIGEPISEVLRIWANKKVIYDFRNGVKLTKKYKKMEVRVYRGDEDQLPDPDMQAQEGVDITPAYRGLAYVLIKDLPLEDFGNSQPQIEVEAAREATQAFFVENIYSGFKNIALDGAMVDRDRMVVYYNGLAAEGVWRSIITKIDLLNNQVLIDTSGRGKHLGGTMTIDVDAAGIPYSVDFTAGFTAEVIVKLDPLSLTYVAQSVALNRHITQLMIDRIGDGYLWTLNSSQQLQCFDKATLALLFTTSGSAHGINPFNGILTVDGDGNAWITAYTSGIRQLVRVTPAGEVTAFDVSADIVSQIPSEITWDEKNNAIIFFSAGKLVKFDIASQTVTGTLAVSYINPRVTARNYPVNGILWMQTTAGFSEVDLATMTILRSGAYNLFTGGTVPADTNRVVYLPLTHSLHGNNENGVSNHYLDRLDAGPMTLAQVVDEICTGRPEAFTVGQGITDADIDVTDLTQIVDGYVSAKHDPGRALIEQLRIGYFFDGVESDGKIKFINRGGDSVETIPETKLAAHEPGQALPDNITTTRGQETELPRRVNVSYMNMGNDYLEGLQYSGRLITEAVQELDYELPLVLSDDHARQIAEVLQMEMWTARNIRDFRVSNEYAHLDPADPVTIQTEEEI